MNLEKTCICALAVLGIMPLLCLSSCKHKVDCHGLPQEMEGYFPKVSELKFTNEIGDTLTWSVEAYTRSTQRTLTNNPLSTGGTGNKPVCYETLEARSSMYASPDWKFKLTVSEIDKSTDITFSVVENSRYSSFNKAVNATPSTLGDFKVFGDTLVMPVLQPDARFTKVQIVYGQGLMKLHDEVHHCDWTRVW